MNRDISGETDPSRQSSSSNYLVYLFLFSAAFIVILPYLFPAGGMLVRSGKKVDVVAKVKSDGYSKRVSSSSSSSYPTISSSDYLINRVYNSESKCEALEVVVMDLQKVVHIEREKTLQLENEIRVLQISENFLKERVHYLEDKSWESRKNSGSGYASSIEVLLQNAHVSDGKRDGVDTVVHELLKMVQGEKDRTSALETEIRILQRSEAILVERIEKLETQFAAVCKQTNVCDS